MGAAPGNARPAILLGGDVNAVSVARCLAAHGVRVAAIADPNARSPARRSRAVHEFVDLGRGDVQDRWLDWLARRPEPAVLLPCSDDGLELVARHRADLEAAGHVAIEADDDVLAAMLDKERTYEIARRHGIPAPLSVRLRPETLDAGPASVPFPCIVKPSHSHRFARHFSLKALVVRDDRELRRVAAPILELGLQLSAVEIVRGDDDSCVSYYGYLDEHGESLLHLTKRKLRQFPIGFGGGCYHVTSRDDEVAEAGLRFLRASGVRGLACVELKRRAADGELVLIECNHRFTAANELLRLAGADLARFVYDRLVGTPAAAVPTLREGVSMWLPVEDVRALRQYRAAGVLTTQAWLRSLLRPQHFPLLSLSDPGPSLASWSALAVRAARRRRR